MLSDTVKYLADNTKEITELLKQEGPYKKINEADWFYGLIRFAKTDFCFETNLQDHNQSHPSNHKHHLRINTLRLNYVIFFILLQISLYTQ